MNQEFEDFKLGNRIIKLRKWKVRDRFALKEALKNAKTEFEAAKVSQKILVFDCLAEPYALSRDELDYIFAMLRSKSVGNIIKFDKNCPNCGISKSVEIKLDKLFKTSYGEFKTINVNDIVIELQEVKNIEAYNKTLEASNEPDFDDFLYHIKSLNGNESLGINELKEFFENLDISTMDSIFAEYDKMRFVINSKDFTCKCSKCGAIDTISFDEIPNIIPETWFRR